MSMTERIVVFEGSNKEFEKYLKEQIPKDEKTIQFLETIRLYNARVRAADSTTPGFDVDNIQRVDNCIVRSSDFGSVVNHVISNFSQIVSQAHDIRKLYIQNPPRRVIASLESQYAGIMEYRKPDRGKLTKTSLSHVYKTLSKKILGQSDSKKEIVTSLYKIIVDKALGPGVLMFFGPSGVGKTESAKCVSEALGGKLTRVQMSMMQVNEAFEYIFGAEHSKGSFARDLLGRESNVVLLDEFDKVNPGLYNAFYQVFDEGVFADTNYEVDVRDVLFICTSNFQSEAEIKAGLGPAMFSRIDACVQFSDLPITVYREIAIAHYKKIVEMLEKEDRSYIEKSDIKHWFIANAGRYDNVRTMKNNIERAIFGVLADRLISECDPQQ